MTEQNISSNICMKAPTQNVKMNTEIYTKNCTLVFHPSRIISKPDTFSEKYKMIKSQKIKILIKTTKKSSKHNTLQKKSIKPMKITKKIKTP